MSNHNNPTKHKLTIEMVPGPNWKWNLRSELSSSEWDKLRKQVYQDAGYKCEICGGVGSKHPVEAHEKWKYIDGDPGTQILVGVEALCPKCHMVRHAGLWFGKKMGHVVLAQLVRVNGISVEEAEEMVIEAFKTWRERSAKRWNPPDIEWLNSKLT